MNLALYVSDCFYIIDIAFLQRNSRKRIYAKHGIFSGFGGLEVACWPLVPKFADSNPAEAVGFFRAKKSSALLPSEGK